MAQCYALADGTGSKGDVARGSAMALEVVGCKTRLAQERAKQLAAKG